MRSGGSTGAPLSTVTGTFADVVWLVPTSRARALRVWPPFGVPVVSQLTLYGAAVSSSPRGWPSRRNCTPATPMSSDALAVTLMVPLNVEPAAGAVTDTDGGLLSAGAPLVNQTESCELAPLQPVPPPSA